jgi:sec-independent protein translocase protein TatA
MRSELMPFNLGPVEMLFVMVVLLLLFGARRLPELGSGLGRGIREFRRTVREVKDEIATADPSQQLSGQSTWVRGRPSEAGNAASPDATGGRS